MTLDSTILARYTPFSVGATASATVMLAADLTAYAASAKERLDLEKPAGLSSTSATYDKLHAYLVAHEFITKDPANTGEFQSESIAGYSYSRKGDIKAGSTVWEQRYLNELASWGRKSPSAYEGDDVERADATLPVQFALDANEIPVFDGTEEGGVDF